MRFGLPAKLPDSLLKLIKAADRNAAYLESTRLAGFEEAEARKSFGPAAEIFGGDGARLSDALAGFHRRQTLLRTDRQTIAGLSFSPRQPGLH